MGIHIEINKELGISGIVTMYASLPCNIGLNEAQRFHKMFGDVINIAIRWQHGTMFADPKPDEKPASVFDTKKKRGRPLKRPVQESIEETVQ